MANACFLKYIMQKVVIVVIIAPTICKETKWLEIFNFLRSHNIYVVVNQLHDVYLSKDITFLQPLTEGKVP
jgi:hypothetical protein